MVTRLPLTDLDPVFVGRRDSMAEIEAAFASGARVVTIVGGPGMGKTRLATRFAVERTRAESLIWIDVEASLDLDELVGRVSASVGVQSAERGSEGLSLLVESIEAQGQRLLVLDCIEGSIQSSRHLLEPLSRHCADLCVLVTSQVPLGLHWEQRLELEPLSEDESYELFVARVRQTQRSFEPSEDDKSLLRRLLSHVDHVPLAVELAAGQASVLPLAELERRMRQEHLPLPPSRRASPPRHQTMEQAVAWSWSLLSSSLQRALTDLAVFRGPFTIAAAEAVMSGGGDQGALALLMALRERSLLQRAFDGKRLQLLGAVRRYAEQRLGAEGQAVRDRHSAWFAGHVNRTVDLIYGVDGAVTLDELEVEQDDLRAAMEHAMANLPQTAARCALVLARYYAVRGPGWTALEVIEQGWAAAKRTEAFELKARLQMGHAILSRMWFARLETEALQAVVESLEGRSPTLEAEARAHHAYSLLEANRRSEAEIAIGKAVSVAEADGLPVNVTLCRGLVALARLAEGRLESAVRELDRTISSAGASMSWRFGSRVLAARGHARLELAQFDAAKKDLTEALRLQDDVGDRLYAPTTLVHLGALALIEDRPEQAQAFAQEAQRRIRASGSHRIAADPTSLLGWIHLVRSELDEARIAFLRSTESLLFANRRAGAIGLATVALLAGRPEAVLAETEAYKDETASELSGHRAMIMALRVFARHQMGESDEASAVERKKACVALIEGGSRRAAAVVQFALEHRRDPTPWPELRTLALARDDHQTWTYDLETSLLTGPDGERLVLKNRPKLECLVRLLAIERVDRPNQSITKERLIAAGWQGDRAQSTALENRLWVTLSNLRKQGFGELLERTGDGYRFRADLRFEVTGRRRDGERP